MQLSRRRLAVGRHGRRPGDPDRPGHPAPGDPDQRRASRALLYPWLRVVSRMAVTRSSPASGLPVQFPAHATMDRLCLWFLRRFVAPDAVSLLIRHFIVETNLLNFCVRNAAARRRRGQPAPGHAGRPRQPRGDRARPERLPRAVRPRRRRGPHRRAHATSTSACSTSPTSTPNRDPAPAQAGHPDSPVPDEHPVRALPDPAKYRRAVHSMRLDTSLLILATITGDPVPPLAGGAAAGAGRQQHRRTRDGLRARADLRVRPRLALRSCATRQRVRRRARPLRRSM